MELDIDIFEFGDDWRDDMSLDSNQVDDEDEIESGEVVFSKLYFDIWRYLQKWQGWGIVYDVLVQ